MDIKKLTLVCSLSLGFLTGCGGSGSGSSAVNTGNKSYSGNTAPAVITADNKASISESGIQIFDALAVDVSELQYLPYGIESTSNIDKKTTTKYLATLKDKLTLSNLPIGASETEFGSCGGSATATGTESSFKVVFNNYCESEYDYDLGYSVAITLNGTVTGSVSDTKESFSFNNLTMNYGSEQITFNGNMTSLYYNDREVFKDDLVLTTSEGSIAWMGELECYYSGGCTYKEYFEADNGVTYRADDYSVNEYSDGWRFEGNVFDPTFGSFYLTANEIKYCTDGSGNIESGSMVITDAANNEMVILFTSCDGYIVNFNNVATGHEQ